MATKPWSSTAPPGEFRPYVDAGESLGEFSLRAVVLGSLFGILFGAVSVYVGLRAGLTVSASIPIAVRERRDDKRSVFQRTANAQKIRSRRA